MTTRFLFMILLAFAAGIAIVVTVSHPFGWFEQVKQLHVSDASSLQSLDELAKTRPDLEPFIQKARTWEEKVGADPNNAEFYFSLGLAWKSIGDRVEERPNPWYASSLAVYEKGVELTERKDTIFLMNAGNLAELQRDYPRAETYFLDAVRQTPGDVDIYIRLADLYRYHMKKSPQDIVALLDKGIAVAALPSRLVSYKELYLGAIKE